MTTSSFWEANNVPSVLDYDYSFSFDGNTYIDFDTDLNDYFKDSFSFSLWIKRYKINDQEFILTTFGDGLVRSYTSGGGNIVFHYSTDNVIVATAQSSDSKLNLYENEWVHLGLTADSGVVGPSGLKIYIDGSITDLLNSSQGDTTGIDFTDSNLSSSFRLGENSLSFTGNMSDFRLYDYALSSGEIYDLRNGLEAYDTPVGHWKLDGETATKNDNINLYMSGPSGISTSNIDLYVKGDGVSAGYYPFNSDMNLFMARDTEGVADRLSMYIHQDTESNDIPLVITGAGIPNSSVPLYLYNDEVASNNNNVTFYTHGF